MASLVSAATFDRIFSETTAVVAELGDMAQKVIETEAPTSRRAVEVSEPVAGRVRPSPASSVPPA